MAILLLTIKPGPTLDDQLEPALSLNIYWGHSKLTAHDSFSFMEGPSVPGWVRVEFATQKNKG